MTEGFIIINEKMSFSKKDVVAVVRSTDHGSYSSAYLRGGTGWIFIIAVTMTLILSMSFLKRNHDVLAWNDR